MRCFKPGICSIRTSRSSSTTAISPATGTGGTSDASCGRRAARGRFRRTRDSIPTRWGIPTMPTCARPTAGVEDIQEKKPFTDHRMQEFASSGTYYFASARILFAAFRKVVEQDLRVGGEYYASLAYKPLLAEGRPVAVYPLQHFMQWGTPEDVAEYRTWSRTFRSLAAAPESGRLPAPERPSGTIILPLAGMGRRFSDAGYALPKPLIPVSGKSMVVQAVQGVAARRAPRLRVEGRHAGRHYDRGGTDTPLSAGSRREGSPCHRRAGLHGPARAGCTGTQPGRQRAGSRDLRRLRPW